MKHLPVSCDKRQNFMSSSPNICENAIIDMNMNSDTSVSDMKMTYSMVNGLPRFESDMDRKRKLTLSIQVTSKSRRLIQVNTRSGDSLKLLNSFTMNGSQKITIGCRCSRTACLKLYCDCFRQENL